MAKRFTDTNKYKKPFIRGLQGAYKLFWDYLYHDCDHAGIWIADFEIAQIYMGKDMVINKEDALKYFNNGEKRIVEFDGGSKWFIIPFIEFQYGKLNEQNRAHNSVIQILKRYKLYNSNKGLITPLQGRTDKDKDKDKDNFEKFWKLYPSRHGKKLGKVKAFEQFVKINPEEYKELKIGVKNYAAADTIPKDAFRWLRDKLWKEWQEPENDNTEEKPEFTI